MGASQLHRLARRYLGDEAAPDYARTLMVVQAWVVALVVASPLAALYFWLGMQQAALSVSAFILAIVGSMELLRLTRAHALLTHLSLLVASAAFTGIALGEAPLDAALLIWFATLPMLAVMFQQGRAGLAWLVVSVGWVTALLLLETSGAWHRPGPPAPFVAHLARLVGAMVAFFAFAAIFEAGRVRALGAAEAANRSKGTFLANVSHEIRTPMNGVLGMTEVMLQEALEPRQREQLSTIQRSGRILVALIDDLLDLAKVEAGRLSLECADLDLPALLEDLVTLYRPRAEARGTALRLELGPGVPRHVQGDGLRLRQVLANLVGNAVKFTSGGSVTVKVAAAGALLRFEVEDTGVGIAPELQGGLFQPFQQGDASTTRRFGGTGLGLALARELVTLMGGQIGLTSSPGAGSTFWFEVPLASSAAPPPPAVRVSPPPALAPGSRLLVVDDNEINLTVARALLERAGCQVDLARDGLEALQALERTPYALVLMDCQMPVLDGLAATRRIRQLPGAAGRTPVVALTASAMSEELAACRAAGMDDCLTKPFGMDQLLRLLATWLPPTTRSG